MVSGKTTNETVLAERHAHLVACTTELLLQKGFHETSVREIADAANWNMGTLYRYINQKEDVLFLVFDDLGERFERALTETEPQPTAAATLRLMAERYFRIVAENRREFRLLYREAASLLPEHRVLFRRRNRRERDVIAGVIRQGVEAGEFRPVNAELFADTFLMLGQMWALRGPILHEYLTADEFARHQIDLLMNELAPVPAVVPARS